MKIKNIIGGLILSTVLISTIALAWSLPPSIQKGDLIVATSTTQAVRLATSTAGYVLQMKNGMPAWVATSTLGISGGSSATTTINSVNGPTFIFSSPSSTIHISSSTGNIFFDFGSMLISQFTNDSGYIATSTGNWLGTWQSLSPNYFQTALGYTPASSTTGSAILKGNGSGGFSSASNGTDYTLSVATTCSAGQHIYSASSTGQFYCSADTGTGSGATTTINGVIGPDFTFNILGTNGLSYSSSTGVLSLTQATSTSGQSGFLSSADWTTFNSKVSSSTPFSAGRIPYATSTNAITDSNIFQSGLNIGIGTTTPATVLVVNGTSTFVGNIVQASTATSSATSTVSIGQSGNTGCIEIRDNDNGNWSNITTKGGIMYINVGQCQ